MVTDISVAELNIICYQNENSYYTGCKDGQLSQPQSLSNFLSIPVDPVLRVRIVCMLLWIRFILLI